MKVVIYRHNPTLAALVAKAKPDFVYEFPAEMSVEDIKKELEEGGDIWTFLEQVQNACSSPEDWENDQVHVDATVMAAGINECLWSPCRLSLIRQDDVGAYDWYASRVAEAAKHSGRVILVSDRIADHNSERPEDTRNLYKDEAYRKEVESLITQKWVERLAKCGVITVVVTANQASAMNLQGEVVVCDHHASDSERRSPKEFIRERGGVYFNAYPPCQDDDFLSN